MTGKGLESFCNFNITDCIFLLILVSDRNLCQNLFIFTFCTTFCLISIQFEHCPNNLLKNNKIIYCLIDKFNEYHSLIALRIKD